MEIYGILMVIYLLLSALIFATSNVVILQTGIGVLMILGWLGLFALLVFRLASRRPITEAGQATLVLTVILTLCATFELTRETKATTGGLVSYWEMGKSSVARLSFRGKDYFLTYQANNYFRQGRYSYNLYERNGLLLTRVNDQPIYYTSTAGLLGESPVWIFKQLYVKGRDPYYLKKYSDQQKEYIYSGDAWPDH
ncbi:hypothetical protein [Lacticaseibacillus daqingensis]|uniref:hypothetical protein n=1 Tax=Lacticaseibacillus daqingensis TaxID=2486014 RepID=UPI000F770E58|nr:hypothetical protein [Lacticaseibacillus daqingensis]